ncbi:MAG: DUF2723 domain-containing protein [Prevotella sp.]|nr:DUF2723 domain-containing protein [Prevotella sp.]
MPTNKYQLVNNLGGWFVFIIALITYWLTLEPTASYWDCGEFIIQADKLEVGHPPGNPIFMLTARFFANFATDFSKVSLMVNAMSGLLSALTILLLFWTISHLVRKLIVRDGQSSEISIQQYIIIMGSAIVGSLAYCWSDTFWFSAVEGEVYAFSSFCTALVFWLILKWENRADLPHSDRYLILIAYIIGVSVAVHLLNLLCIPAIVLVFAYRRWSDMNLKKSLLALLISFGIIVLVLYGLVPGFIKVAQWFELMFVNGFHMSFNSGAIAYAIITAAVFVWALYELQRRKSALMIKVSFFAGVLLSGMFFCMGWIVGMVLTLGLALWLFFVTQKRGLPVRVLNIIMWSISVIFVGYSSYALILIRSSANTPMNQNAPDNVFDLASYLNREQYGENPLIYGETMYSAPQKHLTSVRNDTIHVYDDGSAIVLATPIYGGSVVEPGASIYAKGVAGAEPLSEYNFLSESEKNNNAAKARRGGDYYVKRDYKPEVKMNPELNMFFPRLYSRQHVSAYGEWVNLDTVPGQLKSVAAIDANGNKIAELDTQGEPVIDDNVGSVYYPEKKVYKPTFGQNLSYFFNYQLNHMYLRYFMWNFAGRQNDLLNQHGELDAGNWISGIPAIDNSRLGDQSLLPPDLGSENPGNNKYYMLPLLLGLIGLIWQSFAGKKGIEQFWVVFFLFFMTGIAIVIYLNQTPLQPRERDYAFAGSFYAFAMWIGMGVAGLWRVFTWAYERSRGGAVAKKEAEEGSEKTVIKSGEEPEQLAVMVNEPSWLGNVSRIGAIVAFVLGIFVPLQMVSQTWDDHDRSGRYAARDFAINYLESLEPNAIVFCNGDNDTFPLWYAQEVEGVRPDVRIINLSYLNSDWYANQHRLQAYKAAPVHFTAKPSDYAYGRQDVTIVDPSNTAPADLMQSLTLLYSDRTRDPSLGYRMMPSSVVTIPVDKKAVVARGLVAPQDTAKIVDKIEINLANCPAFRNKGYLSLGEILMLDIIATNAADGWPRPIYWASTVGDEYHLGLSDYMRSVGMNHQLVPTMQPDKAARTDRGLPVVRKYRWGGADAAKVPYFDETARRMLYTTRTTMLDVASQLEFEAEGLAADGKKKEADAKYRDAVSVVDLMLKKLPPRVGNFELTTALTSGQILCESGKALGDKKIVARGLAILKDLLKREAGYLRYSTMVRTEFVNPALTYETQMIPYQYYRIIQTYTQYGGSMKDVEAILRPTGTTVAQLKQYYDAVYGSEAGADVDVEMDPAGMAQDIATICKLSNEIAGMAPADLASVSAEEHQYDSLLWYVVNAYQESGGRMEDLEKYPEWRSLDKERSKRLYQEYLRKHPELTEEL